MFSGRLIFKNTLLLTSAALLLRLLSMLFQAYLAGYVGAEGLGLIQLVLSVLSFALTLGLAGARVTVTCLAAEEHGCRRPAGVRSAVNCCLGWTLLASFLAAAALFLLSPWLARSVLHEPQMAVCLRLAAGLLPVSCVNLVLSGYFTATGQVLRLTAIDASERIVCFVLTFFLLRAAAGDTVSACLALLGGDLLASCAAAAMLYAQYRRADGRAAEPAPGHMARRVRQLASSLALSDYLRAALRVLEQFLIPWGLMQSGAARQSSMAAYGTITGMVFPILMCPAALLYALIDLLIPELAACRAQGHLTRLSSVATQCLQAGLLFCGFIAGLLFCLAAPLTTLLYRSDAAGDLLRMFSPLILILYMDVLVDGMLKGLSQQISIVRYNTLTSALDVVFLFVLLPRWGLRGYIFTFAATHILNFALSLRRLLLVSGCRLPLDALARVLLCTAGAAAIASLASVPDAWPLLALRAVMFSASYILLSCLTGAARRCLPQSLCSLLPSARSR